MVRKTRKYKYTAFVPKTVKATKRTGKKIFNSINYIFNSTAKTLKKTTKILDKRVATSISSLTKRQHRR
jgi:hypothetical protein